MFKRIDHIELLTATPERTIAFYVGVLGFRERDAVRFNLGQLAEERKDWAAAVDWYLKVQRGEQLVVASAACLVAGALRREPALELGIVCGQCDVVSPLGTRVCAACGHDLRLFPGKPSVRVQMPSTPSTANENGPRHVLQRSLLA